MELRDLEAFLAGAQTGHFGRAADARHMTQSALSKAVGRIEAQLGVPLFDRVGRTVRLNRYGELFRTHAEQALQAVDAGRAAVADAVDPERGVVALAFFPTLGPTFIPRIVQEFGEQHPRIRFLLSPGSSANVVDMLLNGQVDLGLASPDPQLPDVDWTPLWSERLVLVGATGTAAGHPVELREVGDRPFVALKPGYGLRQITDELCTRAGINPRVVFEGADVPTVRGLVGAGLGIAILPPAAGPDVQWSPPERDIADAGAERTVGIAYARERFMPTAVRTLHSYIIRDWQGTPL